MTKQWPEHLSNSPQAPECYNKVNWPVYHRVHRLVLGVHHLENSILSYGLLIIKLISRCSIEVVRLLAIGTLLGVEIYLWKLLGITGTGLSIISIITWVMDWSTSSELCSDSQIIYLVQQCCVHHLHIKLILQIDNLQHLSTIWEVYPFSKFIKTWVRKRKAKITHYHKIFAPTSVSFIRQIGLNDCGHYILAVAHFMFSSSFLRS